MATPSVASPRPGGRPRDPDVDAAILGATMRLLGEVGYQALSMTAVASAAGVGRPTLYRRYRTKADLVVAAILRADAGPEPVTSGGARTTLAQLLAAASRAVTIPGGMAILGSLLAEQHRDPSLLAAFRARIFDPRRAVIHGVLRQGIASGEVAQDADREAIDALLFGALLARAILGEPVDRAWTDRVADQVWRGIGAVPETGSRV